MNARASIRAIAEAHLTKEQRWALAKARAVRNLRGFDPDEPRDEHGMWTDGGDGEPTPTLKPGEAISGLNHPGIEVSHHLLKQAVNRGAFDLKVNKKIGDHTYVVGAQAKIPEGIRTTKGLTGKTIYYNPKLAEPQTVDAGTQWEHQIPRPKAGLSTDIEPIPEKDVIYRGMRNEEFQQFKQTGKLQSRGDYNIGPTQVGHTYFAIDPKTAQAYANGFAPWPHQATFEKPAYIVAIKQPKESYVNPQLPNEIGVTRPIDKSEVLGVWRGDVYRHDPGEIDLRREGYSGDKFGEASAFPPSSSVVWQREEFAKGGGDVSTSARPDRSDEWKAEDEKYQTEKLIDDGPHEGMSRVGIVRDKYAGLWGASHTGSSAITGWSAKEMGIPGYADLGANEQGQNLGKKFLDAIANGRLSREKLYHGFNDKQRIDWKVGDTVRLPLTAASGAMSDSMGYGINYTQSDEGNAGATAFEFPAGTPMAGYSRWDRNASKDFGHEMSEAITAGEFKVTGIRTEHEHGYRSLPVKVVSLAPVRVFNPADKKWRKGL